MAIMDVEVVRQIGQMPAFKFWLLATGAILVTAAAFAFAFRWLRRARLIEDMPTSRIRSAAQGYVELEGTARAMAGEPVIAPLTGQPCCWYRYKVERRGDRGGWRRLEHGASDALFLLEDGTGRCVVDPEGADVTLQERHVWYGTNRRPGNAASRNGNANMLLRVGRWLGRNALDGDRYRYTEELIVDGMPLYAMGEFKTLDELDDRRARGEITRGLLREWKRDGAALLARFDANEDGRLDEQEWEAARQLARKEAARMQQAQHRQQIPHLLFRPRSGRAFLLSTKSQSDLARRYRWRAAGGAAAFLLAGGAATWLITARMLG